MRAYGLMTLLARVGYRVDFLPDDGFDAGHDSDTLTASGVFVHHVAGTRRQGRWLIERADTYDAVIVSRYHLAEALFPMLRRAAPRARLILDTVDLHHLREAREAEQRADVKLRRLALETRRRELAAIDSADACWVVSPVEQKLIALEAPSTPVYIVSNLHEAVRDVPGPQRRHGLLFVGGAAHPPNVDAVRWLSETLFPLIRERLPNVEMHLVGEGLAAVVPAEQPGVTVHGHVRDLRPLLRNAKVGLAPLRFGAGVKGKVNLGLAHGLPMVVTECAAEGLHLTHGENVLIANTPDAFVDAVAQAYNDDLLWDRISRSGRDLTAFHFNADSALDSIRASLKPLMLKES